jgi:transcriptional regulator with XRE-family HTH domain
MKKGGIALINTNKIKGRMAELQITQKDVANSLGLAQPTVNQKINNIRPMDLNEAEKLSDLLHIEPKDFAVYFFYRESCAVQN